jgi:8-oxo-dGTP pyrophosphatase MutT (NUDIX family)
MQKYRKAVFILPYSKKENKVEYLLLKRKLHWKGWEFSKGKIEPGETNEQTAKRELHEETGLKIIHIKRFPFSGKYYYQRLLPDRPQYKGQTFSLFSAEVKKGKVTLDPKEHNGHKWVDFSHGMKILKWPNQKKSLKMVNSWLNKRK